MASLRPLAIVAAVSVGVFAGVGGMTFHHAEGTSYLSTDPAACANCHIMQSQYDSWQKASHHTAASCNDCHLPAGFLSKWIGKSVNGWNHSAAFTRQDFHEPIRMTAWNAEILQDNCVRCHTSIVHAQTSAYAEEQPRCVKCHATVGHGERAALGGPFADDPMTEITTR
jgi:cytochrome c nitrite reductase small subunit